MIGWFVWGFCITCILGVAYNFEEMLELLPVRILVWWVLLGVSFILLTVYLA